MMQYCKWLLVAAFLFFHMSHGYAAELTTWQYKDSVNKIYELRDGTVFKVNSGYVGYMGYNEEVVFMDDDTVCMNGSRFSFTLYEIGSRYHYSLQTYYGAEAFAKFEEICGF